MISSDPRLFMLASYNTNYWAIHAEAFITGGSYHFASQILQVCSIMGSPLGTFADPEGFVTTSFSDPERPPHPGHLELGSIKGPCRLN
jgi:hypothetical protein